MMRLMNLSCNVYLVVFVVIVGIITDVVTCDFIDDLHLSSLRVRRGPPDCSRCRTELCRMYCGTPGGRKRSISDSQVFRKKFPIRRRISLFDSVLDRLSTEKKQSIMKALVAKLHKHETSETDHQLLENRLFSKKS
ncbi:uncharacterized protein LOC129256459 [Lytechinus pictus]|uniref:uncharacterized protein LOC129256459 n=1 Tax=Lytechinus pictus TaxID=7653 RepID=UPI0030BA1C13